MIKLKFLLENSEVCKVDGFLMGNVVLKNFQVFEKWLQEHKAQYDKVSMRFVDCAYRVSEYYYNGAIPILHRLQSWKFLV